MNENEFIRPDIIAMKPYTPILPFEVLSARLGRPSDEIIKLDPIWPIAALIAQAKQLDGHAQAAKKGLED